MDRPRYRKGDEVCFSQGNERISGRIVNIDTFGFEEYEYDVYLENANEIWKHIEESAIALIDSEDLQTGTPAGSGCRQASLRAAGTH